MNEEIIITEPDQLDVVGVLLEDSYFELDDIALDSNTHILTIPFGYEAWEEREVLSRFLFIKKTRVPTLKYILKIFHAESCEVGKGDKYSESEDWDWFLEIWYDEQSSKIRIETFFSRDIQIRVRDVKICVEKTKHVLSTRIHNVIFSPPFIYTGGKREEKDA